MQRHDADPDLSAKRAADQPADQPGATEKKAYVPPVIPMGIPHVVQFVTGSLLDQSPKCQLVGDRMSRYADADGWVSIAQEFICEITGVGSKNTVIKYHEFMVKRGILLIKDVQGGNERKSKRYRFLGEHSNWQPLQVEEPGTDYRVELYEARKIIRELEADNTDLRADNEELRARLELLTNGSANDHTEAIRRSDSQLEVTDGPRLEPTDAPHSSYESGVKDDPAEDSGANRHFEVTDGSGLETAESPSDNYETECSSEPPKGSTASRHFGLRDGRTEGQEYLARRARVEPLVMEFRDHYHRSFRGGIPAAVHYFSESAEREEELQVQLATLRADREAAGHDPPQAADEPIPSGRRGVEPCPDCDRPFTTHGGAEYCPECTLRRIRGGES